MKIVFYIRAIFGDTPITMESMCDYVKIGQSRNNFNSVSRVSLVEYRKRVHDIQMSCLKDISPHIIHNKSETNRHTFDCIQPSTLSQLLSLDDDDVVIPLDDDDWISPEIKNIEFGINHMTIWNTVRIMSDGIYHYKKNIQLPYRPLNAGEPEYSEATSVLSNCVAFRADFLKTLALKRPEEPGYFLKYPPDLRACLQLHTQPRLVIRDKKYSNAFTENILDKYLSIYVRHAGNVTGTLKKIDTDELTRDKFECIISPYKKQVTVPEQFSWSRKYFDMLYELNNQL